MLLYNEITNQDSDDLFLKFLNYLHFYGLVRVLLNMNRQFSRNENEHNNNQFLMKLGEITKGIFFYYNV